MPRLYMILVTVLLSLALSLSAQAAGLLAPTDLTLPPLRVTKHAVDVEIHDQIALTRLEQTFYNDTSRQLEATYVFPLPENAELTNFQMSFNGRMVEGRVLPADDARRIYESIVRQSKDPGLIEFIGRRLLQMRVFPIEPGADTRIEVKYQQICKPVSDMNGYHYPLRTSKTSGQAYGSVRFNVRLDMTAPLKNIWSPTHSVEIVRQGEHAAQIAYEASKGGLEDDFLLLYDTDASDLGLSVIAHKPVPEGSAQPGHFVLTLTPKQLWPKQDYQPQDVVFVIDTSGSMAGEKIEQAKSALKFCIDKLDERDRFSIVRFSTGFDVFAEELVSATRQRRSEAQSWIGKFSAAGGTNINDALKRALDMRDVKAGDAHENRPAADERPLVVVFITDGQGNQSAQETMKLVKEHPASAKARVFSFGVGHDVNTILLDQLATNYSGKPTYVQPGENLELVLGDFFSVISQPVLTNVKLTLPDIGVTEKFPATLGDLYNGQQIVIAGKFEASKKGTVTLTAMRNGVPVEYQWKDVNFTNTAEADYVPAIWAGRKVAFLLDQIRAHGENDEMIAEVVALGQEHGLQTPYTSWLVDPERQQRVWRHRPPARRPESPGAGAGGYSNRDAQRQALSTAAGREIDADLLVEEALDPEADYAFDEEAVGQAAGEAATAFARKNAELRDARSKEASRAAGGAALSRKIGQQWYNRIGAFLVDERVDSQTKITTVRFGSDAYFEVAQLKPELKNALAASTNVVVMVSPTHAILVSDRAGIEKFSDQEREQSGLAARK